MSNQLRQSWQSYNHVNYDLQVKAGWYMGLQAAVSGLNFRWHETPHNSGQYEGYGLAFMRYTYSRRRLRSRVRLYPQQHQAARAWPASCYWSSGNNG